MPLLFLLTQVGVVKCSADQRSWFMKVDRHLTHQGNTVDGVNPVVSRLEGINVFPSRSS